MLRVLALLFALSMFIPVEFYVMLGSVRLEPYRLVLLATLIYAVVYFPQTKRQADGVDISLLLLLGIAFASFWVNHGIAKAIQSTGLYAVETLGAFYLARLAITTPLQFYRLNQLFISILAVLTVFTVYEALSKHRILHDLAQHLTGHVSLDPRLYTADYMRAGLMRAASLFEHPILYGTLTALFFPFAVLSWQRYHRWRDVFSTSGLWVSMIFTLSSAPILSVLFQVFSAFSLKLWHQARRLWFALLFTGLAVALLIQVVSNRGFFGILISYLTFNPHTGYSRILQWEYAARDIANHPLLGIAHHDWTRPYWLEWLGTSIDSFWLLLILQHGMFALCLLLWASLYTTATTIRVWARHDARTRWMVTAWLLSFMSLIFIGFTVDYFGKLQPMFFFMLGAISWAKNYTIWQHHPAEEFAPTAESHDTAPTIPQN